MNFEREAAKLAEELIRALTGKVDELGDQLTAANSRISELTQCDPAWFDASPTDAFRMWAEDRAKLATVTAERDELASDIVRLKAHLEAAERAAKANGEEAKAADERADKAEESCKILDCQIVRWRQSSNRHLAKLIMAKGETRQWEQTATNLLARAERSEARAKVMREAIELAPHPIACAVHDGWDCTCWKREALQEATND